MSVRRTVLLAAIFSLAPTAMVLAQAPNPPPDSTSPSSASSPHQRDATSTPSQEASPTDGTQNSDPSAASTPHQHMASKSAMKECIAKQQSDNSGMSKTDAKKACKAQMKGPG